MLNALRRRLPAAAGRALESNGHVFSLATTVIMAVLLVLAARYHQTAVAVVLGLAVATIVVSRLWSVLALRRVSCTRTLTTNAVFPGEEVGARTQVVNNKPLPMLWVETSQQLPAGLACAEDPGDECPSLHSFSLPWYSRITWTEHFTAERRGCYLLPPVGIASGDMLGLYPRELGGGAPERIIVYPRIYPVHQLSTQRTDASGERAGISTLQEDPTRMRGIRDYSPGDSLKRVHWKATARQADLMVKVFEPAAVSRLELVLIADNFAPSSNDFELAVSAVASIARFCIERQQQVGFVSNASTGNGIVEARLPAAGGNAHLLAMLELLACLNSSPVHTLAAFSVQLRRLAIAGTALIVVAGPLDEVHVRAFEQLARLRSSFRVLSVDSYAATGDLPFPCSFVRSPDDLLTLGGGRR